MRSPKQTTREVTTNVKSQRRIDLIMYQLPCVPPMLHAGDHQGDGADGG